MLNRQTQPNNFKAIVIKRLISEVVKSRVNGRGGIDEGEQRGGAMAEDSQRGQLMLDDKLFVFCVREIDFKAINIGV